MDDSKKPKHETDGSDKPVPNPPGSDSKDRPARDTREDPSPNPGRNSADLRPKKRP
jgi:hypothetical protein